MTLAFPLTVTRVGHTRFLSAQLGENIDLSVSHVGLTDAAFVPAPTLTALPGEFRRVSTIAGSASGDSTVHMVVRDDAALAYRVRGFGLYLTDGTLFATYGQANPIFEKSALTAMHLAIDIAFPTGNVELLTFGDTNFLLPTAGEDLAGIAELATEAEANAATDHRRIITPLRLGQRLAAMREALLATIATKVPLTRRIETNGLALGGRGLETDLTISVPAATAAQLLFATADNVAVTPASFGGLAHNFGDQVSWTFPGGLILKLGGHRGRATSEVVVPVTFDTAFPTQCFRALVSPYIATPSTGDDYFCQRQGDARADGFSVQYQSDDANGGIDGFDWIALGR
ncbi:hypothetical protein ASE70_05625 [Sphingomonas sp. Leaf22]|uniref:gp53-like domain-containing protein n=1 Tax=Sphingomonas sp. Leaf22 TaxID=1735687 RepID=UPI0006FC986D|nr:hypothetical protein [Sphingomonas sp. Leaf22]KQM79348.1 hypothetical protein ASE70_05625 [Sphingomonas sp. Leaf22]